MRVLRRTLMAGLFALAATGCDTTTTGEIGRVLGGIATTQGGPLTSAEIDAGLREALTVGTNIVSSKLGAENGYFGDPKVRIPLPKTYRDIQSTLSRVGASAPLDDLELRMNRAAEAAVPQARTLVISAVREITIEDALKILNGGDTAATDYLRARTQAQLTAAFTPYVRTALAQSGAFTSLETVAGNYGFGGVTANLQTDLTNHAVGLGLDGIFLYVAEEEKKIRENPLARTSDLLRRVFGMRA